MHRHARALAFAFATVMALYASSASACDLWTAPHPGVRHLHRTAPGTDLHVVLIDLGDPSVSLVATRPDDRFITTSTFAHRYDAQVAVNANFYHHGSCGLAVGDGRVFGDSYEDGCTSSLGFGRANEAAAFDSTNTPRGPLPASWVTEVLTGKPWLLRDGRAAMNWQRPQHLYRPNPRSALGLTGDRRTLVILTADGRRRGVEGANGFELVDTLRQFGVTDAINLDGGGSTTLVMDGRIANRPSDHRERVVVTHLGVRITPGAQWYAAEVVARGGATEARVGEAAEFWVDARNTGRRPWAPDDATAPRIELSDGVTTRSATIAAATPPGAIGRFVARWPTPTPGARSLQARLVTPAGDTFAGDSLRFALAVREAPAAPVRAAPVRPQIARAGFGFSDVGLPYGGCSAAPRSAPSPLAWTALAVFGSLVVALRARLART